MANASQDVLGVPHYTKLLEFLNLRAQASEAAANFPKKSLPRPDDCPKSGGNKQVATFVANTVDTSNSSCCLCKTEKHALFACPQFKTLTHDRKMSAVKSNDLCVNCLRPGHFVRQFRSSTQSDMRSTKQHIPFSARWEHLSDLTRILDVQAR